MNDREEKIRCSSQRLLALAFFLLVLFFAIIAQFYRVQIVEGARWKEKARSQHQHIRSEPFKRGRFFATLHRDKNHPTRHVVLALDLKYYHLYSDPALIPANEQDHLLDILGACCALTKEELTAWKVKLARKSRSQKLKSQITEREKEQLDAVWAKLAKQRGLPRNALYWIEDYCRSYPYGALLGAALGAVQNERDVKTKQSIPTGGLELALNGKLKGQPGKRKLLRSPRQALTMGDALVEAKDGEDIYLTIDPYIQTIAEEEIERAVKRVGAKAGWAIMVDPRSGEIYALAQYPGFTPANYRACYNDPHLKHYTEVRAVTDCFEPGSTFKPLCFAVALLANRECLARREPPLFDPKTMVRCDQGMFPGRKRPLRDVGGPHAFLNLALALQKSSDIYGADVIERVIKRFGPFWYFKQLKRLFKLGQKTGIELPGETAGVLPNPRDPNQWSITTPCCLSMGYNVLVTPFQLLRAYAILLTGCDAPPTLIKRGESCLSEREVLIDAAISRELIDGLKLATTAKGTCKRANLAGYTQGGKSGTAEKVVQGSYAKGCHFASFIGFTPADAPRFLLFIGIDEPPHRLIPGVGGVYFGGFCAAPAFKAIMERTLEYLETPPDDPYGYPSDDPRFDPQKAKGTKRVRAAKELYRQWNRKG